ncbi:hypothetical protein [Paracoccus sp. NSM]|uniref:hypothetical protein n=1 Tax=Paracoccus sp. NSM TaxID=3457784 RepID=UPI0040364144
MHRLLRRTGPAILAVMLGLCATGAGAQDARLALDQGQADLALFALTRTEARISPLGEALLALQGFRHDPAGPRLQPLSQGRALVPVLRRGSNVNGGIPSDRITIGGLPFRVHEDSRAKAGILVGLRHSGWQSLSWGRAARLRLAHATTVEAEPTHGFHRLSITSRACADRPIADWTWAEGCLRALHENDSVDAETSLTGQVGLKRLFQSPIGVHQAQATLSRTRQDSHDKDVFQISALSLTKVGLVGVDLVVGEDVPGQNTLRHLAAISWTGPVAGRTVTLGISQARTGGAVIFGTPRDDRTTRLSAEMPVGKFDLGTFVERRRSTIAAFDGTDAGVTVGLRFSLLK